jgi:hypothetical protein
MEAGHVSDARHWPSLSLGIRKLASTSVELVNMPETRNRTNRAQMISFCARMKTITLIFHETISTRELRGVPTFPAPGSGKIARSGRPSSTGRLATASINASKETDALLLPELKQLISQLSANSSNLVEFEWTHPAKLGPQGANAVVEPLNWRNTFLRVLRLSNQQLGDLGFSYVSKSLKTNRTIEVLDLSGNSATANGVESLIDALLLVSPSKAVLKHLDLSHNLIDFASCGHLARLITNADSITVLLLNNNLLNEVGLTTIANALASNCSLRRLDLQQNPASQNMSVGPIFSHVLETSNYTLTQLDLGGAKLTDSEGASIKAQLDRNLALLDEQLSCREHASPKENAFKRMEVGPESARLHVFSADVLSPAAILRLVVTPLGANITALIMTDCALTKLPPQLCLLGSTLETLDLRRNKLTSLPLEIRAFFKLKRLLLAHNLLQHLPPQLTSLMYLVTISLHGNPLHWIPADVLSHAELDDFPPADTRLFKFLAQAAAATDETVEDTLYGKLMILGQVHTGKSSLCQILDSSFGSEVASSIVSGATTNPLPSTQMTSKDSSSAQISSSSSASSSSSSNPSASASSSSKKDSNTSHSMWSQQMPRYISTEGVCTRSLSIEGSKFGVIEQANVPVTPEAIAVTKRALFTAFEAGGSSIYSAAHSIFFRPDLLYLVTVDLTKLSPDHSRETINELKVMIQTIQTMVGTQFGGAPYIALVGTFEDLLTPSALADAVSLLKSHFEPHILEIFTISNKSSRGLSILRDRVLFWAFRSRLLASPQLGSLTTLFRVLRSYANIRPFISRSELEQICRVYGIEQPNLEFLGNIVDPLSPRSSAPKSPHLTVTDPNANPNALTSAKLSVPDAMKTLEAMGAVMTFHQDPQLECFAFIDFQFIANVFSDIMASADADGYIYRSHVPPLLWMDCRKHASMKSLFDWCRLFGLALDYGNTHYVIPSLLNALPPISVFNAAWPPMENIDGVSSRPHMVKHGVAAPGRAGYPSSPSSNTSSASGTSSSVSSASPPATISPYSPLENSQGNNGSSSPNTIQAVTTTPGSLRLTPAIEKTSRSYHRDMSQVACAEWPVLTRGLMTEFVPSLVFSHLLIAVFSLPGIQRSAWWRNGFIVRRDTSFVKVELQVGNGMTPNQSGVAGSNEGLFTSSSSDKCKILVQARNDSTYLFSKDLLEEITHTMDQLLKRWYPQLEYSWVVPWSHPWLADDETTPLALEAARSALAEGPTRNPTTFGNLTIREELLMPELVDHSKYYSLTPNFAASALVPQAAVSLSPSGVLASLQTGQRFIEPSYSGFQLFKSSTDGATVRFRPLPDSTLAPLALNLSVLRNERITSLHSVILSPPGIAVIMPKAGTLNEVLSETYTDAPLPWAARFRIAIDIALALRYLHSQVPVVALQGLDAYSVLLNENYRDPNAVGPIARIDLSATNHQSWLDSVFAPRPFIPSVQQLSQSTQNSIKLSPHSSDIHSFGVLLLQLWRNEPLEDFCPRIREKLPPVPFYPHDSVGLLAYEQLISACVCDDPTMRPGIEQIITKLMAIASHLDLSSSLKLLSLHQPIRRWRKIKTLQVGVSTDIAFSIGTLCKSSTMSIPKPGTASSPAANGSAARLQGFDETVVWAGGLDGVLYGIPFPMPSSLGGAASPATTPSSGSAYGTQLSSSGQNIATSPSPSYHMLVSNPAGNAKTHARSPSSTAAIQSLHWSTISTSVLDNATVQYRMPTFGPDTRNTKRRIIATETTHRHVWCLLNTVTASVLDPSRLAIVAQVDIGPCLSIASYEDTIYTGGTSGVVSAYDGTTCKRLRSREVCKLPITAIVASSKYVWIAVSNDHGQYATLICLDAQSLQEETRYTHPSEETITSISLTPTLNFSGSSAASTPSSTAASPSTSSALSSPITTSVLTSTEFSSFASAPQILWTGGYTGTIQTFKVTPVFENSDNVIVQPMSTFSGQHKTRLLSFLWNGDFLYSCSSDAISAWKPDSSSPDSHLVVSSADVASFTVLEKSAILTGHRNGSITIWASL